MNYASIDIGSNAVRMMIAGIIQEGDVVNYKKNTLIRIPLRLGDDAFLDHRLSAKKAAALLKAMQAFRYLMDLYKVTDYMACATSALREAANGPEVLQEIKEETGLDIRIIDGKTEAQILYSGPIASKLESSRHYLYIDVGGGSTELSFLSGSEVVASDSFDIGTIRMLDNQDSESTWTAMKEFVRKNGRGMTGLTGIGTGGNINKLLRLSQEKEGAYLSYSGLKETYQYLRSYSIRDRIRVLGLNPDRADVILPASEIYLTVMKWAGVKEIYVPRKGLVDGMISLLIERNFAKQQS